MFSDFSQRGRLSLRGHFRGVEINYPHSSHTCCLHLHHRGAEQPQQKKKTQQEVSKRPSYLPCRHPGQARCSSSFPFLLLTLPRTHLHPHLLLLLLLNLYFSLPPLSLPSSFSLPILQLSPLSRRGCVTESLGLLSHGGDFFNQLHMRSALIWWPSAISPDLRANHRAPQWGSRHASHHRILVFGYLMIWCYQMFEWFERNGPLCFKRKNNETQLKSLNLSLAEQH